MIRASIELKKHGKWYRAPRLGTHAVEKARKLMWRVHTRFGCEVRLVSQFGTVVDATYVDDPNA